MCRVREAWDPERRMNPGKLLPTHACMEVPLAARRPPAAALPSTRREEAP
jgi:hypothetical protein